MKKIRSNSGFTLVPVMAILLLVLTLAGTAIANSILHLRTQETAVEQMSGKYIAAGKIEKTYANLRSLTYDQTTTEAILKDENIKEFTPIIPFGVVKLAAKEGEGQFIISVSESANGAIATAEFEVGYKDNYEPVEDSINGITGYKHNVTITSVRYTKFNISSETGVGG